LIVGASIVLCLASLAAVCVQQRQLAGLRNEQLQLLEQSGTSNPQPIEPATAEAVSTTAPELRPTAAPSSELLQLRNQVGQLKTRQRELQGAQGENDRLRAQIAVRGTNAAAGGALPPGYIRKSEAQWVGAATPENTVQSFLWAVRNHDLTNLLSLLTPEAAEKLKKEIGDSAESFFKDTSAVPGMRILNQQSMPDGSIRAQMEFMPGAERPEKIRFYFVDGQWKLEIP
jgi:hypothetical protein